MYAWLSNFYRSCFWLCVLNARRNRKDLVAVLGWLLVGYAFLHVSVRLAKEA